MVEKILVAVRSNGCAATYRRPCQEEQLNARDHRIEEEADTHPQLQCSKCSKCSTVAVSVVSVVQ